MQRSLMGRKEIIVFAQTNSKPSIFKRKSKSFKASQLKGTKYFRGDVVIDGDLIIDENISVKCNLYVLGKIIPKNTINDYNININGDLIGMGGINCKDIYVTGSFYCMQDIYSQDIKVGEDFICNARVDAFNHNITVAGDFECFGVQAKKVMYLGEFDARGRVSVEEGIKSYS